MYSVVGSSTGQVSGTKAWGAVGSDGAPAGGNEDFPDGPVDEAVGGGFCADADAGAVAPYAVSVDDINRETTQAG
jgi:hypothetical protein